MGKVTSGQGEHWLAQGPCVDGGHYSYMSLHGEGLDVDSRTDVTICTGITHSGAETSTWRSAS